MDANVVKQGIDLRVFVESRYGHASHTNPKYLQYHCFLPGHSDDSSPSLTIYQDGFKCFGCGQTGDIFDLVMLTQGKTFQEALDDLSGEIGKLVWHKNAPQKPELRPPSLDPRIVRQEEANLPRGLDYYHFRGLNDSVIHSHHLGVRVNFTTSYRVSNEIIDIPEQRYALPNLVGDQLYSIQYRRDDKLALSAFEALPDREHDLIVDDVARKMGHDPTGKELVERVFTKYRFRTGSVNRPIGVEEVLFRMEGDKRIPMNQSAILLCAEYKPLEVLALKSAGFPAVGVMYDTNLGHFLPQMFARVAAIFILRDNDSAGEEAGMRVQKALGRGVILSPPDEYKDAGEVALDGKLQSWIPRVTGIQPKRFAGG